MSGGKRIDDHSFWVPKSKGMVLPNGAHLKSEKSAEGSGHEAFYEDTTEAIKSAQQMGDRKVKGHKMKDGYRY